MASVEQRIEQLRQLAIQQKNNDLLRIVDLYQKKSLDWENSPSTVTWAFNSTGCPKGGSKADSYSCPPMYKLVNAPPGRVELSQIRGHESPACHTDFVVSPDRRSVNVTHYNTHPSPGSSWNKYIDEILTFVFEKIPKEDFS